MRDHSTWSVSLGRWGGVHVRLHMLFLLFAAFTFYLSWLAARAGESSEMVWAAGFSLLVLLVSVVIHELGHYLVAVHLGGGADQVVLGPLGGLRPMRTPSDPQSELLVHLAGPLVNLAVCLICLPLLLLAQGDISLVGLLHPLVPLGLLEGPLTLVALKLAFWINWVLVLANLLPAFPFDGGRALRAAIAMSSPEGGRQRAAAIVAGVAKVAAGVLLVLAFFLRGGESQQLLPTWFALVLLAIFLFFSARQEEERQDEREPEEDLFGYDFSQGYTSLERSSETMQAQRGLISGWLAERRAARQQRRKQQEEEEERRVDEILGRLHSHGMDSLSSDDRVLLERVSARYRKRPGFRA